MARVFCCSFECGRLVTSGDHWQITSGAGADISTSIKRSGARALHFNQVNQLCEVSGLQGSPPSLGTGVSTHRFYIYFVTLPSADTVLYYCGAGTSGSALGVGFKHSDSSLRATSATGASTAISFGASGVPIVTGQWYRVDLKADQTSGNKKSDVQIDGVDVAQATSTETGAGNKIIFCSSRQVTGEWYIDDHVIDNSDVYPIGEGFVQAFIPTADGTHNISGANQWERGTTGTDITNATTDAFELINELPLDDTTPDADDYIAAVAPANASDYVEVKFGIVPTDLTPTVAPTAVEVLVALHQANAGVGNTRLALVDNGTTDDVVNQTDAGVSTINYIRKHYAAPPTGGSWGITAGDGNFLDLRMRFYSSDANPDQYWDGVIIEADFSGTPAEPPAPGGHYACAGTMPQFDLDIRDEINALRSLRDAGEPIGQVFELVKVSWPSPDGDVYYAVLQVDDVATVAPPVSPIETRLIPDGNPDWFLPVQLDASIGDEEVDLSFWDGDGAISDLIVTHGEGIKVELFYWFPQVELLLPLWHGHLRQEDDAERDICKIKAVQGFRSSDLNLPRRAHWQECQAIFGGVFDTQAEIDENDCPYNLGIGGSTGNLNGGVPYTSCPRLTQQNCIDRLSRDGNFMLSHRTLQVIVINNQSKGPRLYSTSQGNETNLKDPVRVIMGTRRIYDMKVMAFRRDLDNRDPDHGWFLAQYEACEGPIQSISRSRITVNGTTQDAVAMHYGFRLGTLGQTPALPQLTTHSYSGTALIYYNFGWVDPTTVDPNSCSASSLIEGLNNIRVYTDETTYTLQSTSNRAWQIMHMLTNKRWGYGLDYDRLDIASFIEAACWCDNIVRFTDFNGDTYDHVRARSDVELTERKVQQQIEDICLAGRLSRPFLFNGKIHIVPLREMTAAELADAPVFTDEGISRNIIWEDGKTTLKRSRISDLDLPNRVECTFDDADNDYLETPCRPAEDIEAQLRAGRVVGDSSRKVNIKKYPLLGVTINNQSIKCAWGLLDLGPFDEGGLQNNLRLKYKIWFLDSLDLFPTKVIKVESSQITRYSFSYFRVMKIKRLGDLQVELEVQAYNEDYMATFETLFGSIDPIPTDPDDPTPVGPTAPPAALTFGTITYVNGLLEIPIEA